MEVKKYALKIEFTEPILGTQPQKDIALEHVQKTKGKDVTDENETLDEALEKGTTAFHKENGKPIYFDYHVRGFLKESANVQNPIGSLKNARSKVDNFVFVNPRRIPLQLPEGWKPSQETLRENSNAVSDYLERPLRAMTMQGPRVSIARSEMLPAGTKMECTLEVLNNNVITENVLRTILDYGKYKGFGQWRNASYGKFTYELTAVD